VTGPMVQFQVHSCLVDRQLVQVLQGHRLLCRDLLMTQGNEETTPLEVTSGKKKPRWFSETLKEAKEYVREP
jgi:hypothetical protein